MADENEWRQVCLDYTNDSGYATPSEQIIPDSSDPILPTVDTRSVSVDTVQRPTKKPKTDSTTRTCSTCNLEVSKANWARHQRGHGIEPQFKGVRETCPACGKEFTYKRRNDHYQKCQLQTSTPSSHDAILHRPIHNDTHTEQLAQAPMTTVRKLPSRRRQSVGQRDDTPVSIRPSILNPQSLTLQEPDGWLARIKLEISLDTKEMLASMQDRLAVLLSQPDYKSTIYGKDFPDYCAGVEETCDARVISAAEYEEVLAQADQSNPDWQYAVVVCTMGEARCILQQGPPHFPLLIPDAVEDRVPLDGPNGVLQYLESQVQVDTHDLALPSEGYTGIPEMYSGPKAVSRFREQDGFPVNFLNLDCIKDNPVVACLAHQTRYNIMRTLKKSQMSGKPEVAYPADLTNSSALQILAKDGAFSFPHVDRYGLLTAVTWEGPGKKGWVTWPKLSKSEKKQWSDNMHRLKVKFPNRPGFMIPLRPGHVLIQPSGTVHAPWTEGHGLGTITEHMDSKTINQHLEAALFEQEHPETSNETEAYEALVKFKHVEEAWSSGNKFWPWGDGDELTRFRNNLEVCYLRTMIQKSC